VDFMKFRLTAFIVAVAGIAVATSCGDPTAIKAQFPTGDDTLEVFAINGTSGTLPSAVDTRRGIAVRVSSSFTFDVAWDINAAGEAVAITPRMVGNELTGARRVGLLLAAPPFEGIVRAPSGGYKYDSLLVVPLDKVLLVDALDPSCSTFSILGQNIRSKIKVDSVIPSRKAIYLRIVSNPNCGFRDLGPGVPKG
jgi:hypothetical protein